MSKNLNEDYNKLREAQEERLREQNQNSMKGRNTDSANQKLDERFFQDLQLKQQKELLGENNGEKENNESGE